MKCTIPAPASISSNPSNAAAVFWPGMPNWCASAGVARRARRTRSQGRAIHRLDRAGYGQQSRPRASGHSHRRQAQERLERLAHVAAVHLAALLYAGSSAIRIITRSSMTATNTPTSSAPWTAVQVPMRDDMHNRHVRLTGEGSGLWAEAVARASQGCAATPARPPARHRSTACLPRRSTR